MWLAAVILLILYWRDIVRKSQKLKRTQDIKKLARTVFGLVSVVFFVVIPITFLEAFEIGGQILLVISNSFFALCCVLLAIGGIKYARKLKKICEGVKSNTGRDTILKVMTLYNNNNKKIK